MKIKVYSFDWTPPEWAKPVLGLVAASTICSVMYAASADLATFESGEQISSSKINGNFTALNQRITALGVPTGTIVAWGGSAKTLIAQKTVDRLMVGFAATAARQTEPNTQLCLTY